MIDSFLLRFGMMHVIATNIILWLRTLFKETLDELSEVEEEILMDQEHHPLSVKKISDKAFIQNVFT